MIRKKVAQAFRDCHRYQVKKANTEAEFGPIEMGYFQNFLMRDKTDLVTNTSNACKQVQTSNKGSECLRKNDILLGRGAMKHFGNALLRHLVTQNLEKYYSKPCQKNLIISEIMGTIKNLNPPGRFMSRDNKTDKWEEVGYIKSQLKVAQSFRDCRYAVVKKSNALNNPSTIFELFD
jgi:hypothetical protein